MTQASLHHDLGRIGRKIRRWQAQVRLLIGTAAILGGLSLFVLSDLLIQFQRPGRVLLFVALLSAIGATLWWLLRSIRHPLTPQAVAASIERAFPELDNHLINYLQFAGDPNKDSFKQAYLKSDIQGWNTIDVQQMKNRRLHRLALTGFCVALLVALLPAALTGRAWAVALWRVTNPFANTAPVSLTQLLSVTPGTTSAPQGQPLVLACTVAGQRGHRVLLDIRPADGEASTHTLGTIEGKAEERFSYRIPLLTTPVRYRFRAGDAPFPKWYEVTPRPPLACTSAELVVTPPRYTRVRPATFDGLTDPVSILEGSRVELVLKCNGPLTNAVIQVTGNPQSTPLRALSEERVEVWAGSVTVTNGETLSILAQNVYGESLQTDIAFTLLPDEAPVITILSPIGQTTLPTGTKPAIDFKVADDYGLASISLERVTPGAPRSETGETIGRWSPENERSFASLWSESIDMPAGQAVAFRIVARDNRPGTPHTVRSDAIVFQPATLTDTSRQQDKMEQAVTAALAQLIEAQRINIERTRACQATLLTTSPEQWNEAAEAQRQIRTLTRELLAMPGNPLGPLAGATKTLYLNEMLNVIDTLMRIPTTPDKASLSASALNMEAKILRQLTYANTAAAQTQIEQRMSVLANMLDALIRGETLVLTRTRKVIETSAEVSPAIVERQDSLAEDLTDFGNACHRESDAIAANDQAFAATLTKLAAACEQSGIRNHMILAAEALDNNKPQTALPEQQQALAKLQALEKQLNSIKASEQIAREERMLDVLQNGREKLEKIRALHETAIQSMDLVKEQGDASSKELLDMMEEEYQVLLKNTKEALLEIPRDLHIFSELNVANELVEDVFSIFEEHEMPEDKDAEEAGDVASVTPTEKAYAKRDRQWLVEKLDEAEERFEKLEEWLQDKPENDVITTESFDKEELPDAGVALGALAAEAEDLIGDLMEDADEGAEKAPDGATNQAFNDDPGLGWEVKEGDIATFAAKGKSGNMSPDHKEQDGRSNVGRQGMAVGENASGSGTIGEGDSNIEARRTQDPTQDGQVDLDGEANTAATGGGKQASGKADDVGMGGGTRRMDSTEEGSMDGMDALMAKQVDALYTKASLKNVRADSLKVAAHHLRQADDAIAQGRSIEQIRELRKQAVAALKRGKTQLEGGAAATLSENQSSALLDDVVASGPDDAPPRYRDLVADYYKKLNDEL